ncbi:DUF937 domain-containing protein [Luteimonas suaedae]|uniref:DUF937 domain-containing protein n=1 Tax=Luteimonas suaedae TaxID=2605430 RepID=UPI0011EF8527|nr:DUF937 domain-containing protein [Luteimonas suaedae]
MTDSLTDQLLSQLDGAPLQQIAQQLGVGQAQAAGAVGTALPLLMGALGRNASQSQGAEALFGALQKNHAGGDIGSVLGAVLGGASSPQADGAGILGHVFGGRQQRAEAGLGQATGLGGERAGQLLKILAPIVLAFLAKQTFQGQGGGGSPATPQGLGAVLGQEQQQVARQGGAAGLLGAVLDQDGDGELGLGDLLKIGGGLLGSKT